MACAESSLSENVSIDWVILPSPFSRSLLNDDFANFALLADPRIRLKMMIYVVKDVYFNQKLVTSIDAGWPA